MLSKSTLPKPVIVVKTLCAVSRSSCITVRVSNTAKIEPQINAIFLYKIIMTDLYIMTHLAKIVATGNTNRSMYLTAGS